MFSVLMLVWTCTSRGLRYTFVLRKVGTVCWLAQQAHSLRKERLLLALPYLPQSILLPFTIVPSILQLVAAPPCSLPDCFSATLCARTPHPQPYPLVSDTCKPSTSPSPFEKQMTFLIFSCISNNSVWTSHYNTADCVQNCAGRGRGVITAIVPLSVTIKWSLVAKTWRQLIIIFWHLWLQPLNLSGQYIHH